MKLASLHIRSQFKNLTDFSIKFGEESSTTVLVGRNGTGKSNILEATTLIFRDLDLNESPRFSYELSYACRGNEIKIDGDPERESQSGYQIHVNGEAISWPKFFTARDMYLPSYVFGYYSGTSNRMEEHFDAHQNKFYTDLLKDKENPLRRLLYARPVHGHFALLAFFLEKDSEVKQFLQKQLRIVALDYALFVMREPMSWKSKKGDPRFWFARGTVQGLLSKLYDLALAPLRRVHEVRTGFRKATKKEHLYLFLKGITEIRELAAQYRVAGGSSSSNQAKSQQAFFKALESTYISELISEIRVNVKATNVDGSITFREMSEGEQQLLMVLGLLRFTREDEALFLLDEPDTHLNAAWSVQYLDFLEKIGGTQKNSHVVMATHDPLVVIGLEQNQVQLLQRDDQTNQITANPPARAPKRMSIASLLTSEIYGLRSAMSIEMLGHLDDLRALRAKNKLNKKDKDEIERLQQELGAIDSTTTVRDPMYAQFVEAMAEYEREHNLHDVILTLGQKAKQKAQAMAFLKNRKRDKKQ